MSAMNDGYTYTGHIAQLEREKAALVTTLAVLNRQIENQRVGSREVQTVMQKLERENELLKSGLAMCSPAAIWPNPA